MLLVRNFGAFEWWKVTVQKRRETFKLGSAAKRQIGVRGKI